MPASIREITPAELSTLEALVCEVFGAGDRPRGWFERKLEREVVDPALSKIALDRRGRPIGFLLASAPPSLPGVLRLVSLGVLPASRSHGIGRALIDAAAMTAAAAGLQAMTALAEADRRSFYADTGFSPEAVLQTLLAPRSSAAPRPAPTGRSPSDDSRDANDELDATIRRLPPAPWERPGTLAIGGWLAEAWERTAAELRQTYAIGDPPRAWAHVSREGEAQLIHRLLLRARPAPEARELLARVICELAQSLAEALTPDGPLLLYGLTAVSPITISLLRAGWTSVQESARMVRPLSPTVATAQAPAVDRPRPPAP